MNWTQIPDDWTDLPPALAKQRSVKALIAAGVLVETRTLPSGTVQWRRKP